MSGIAVSRVINAPVDVVFAMASDVEHFAGRIKQIKKTEMLTPGPVGVGTRFKETRLMFGKEATEEMTFTEFEPNKSYTLEANTCGALYVSRFSFQPEGQKTRVEVSLGIRALSFWAKLMKPLAFLMRGMMVKCLTADLDDLQRNAEETAKVS